MRRGFTPFIVVAAAALLAVAFLAPALHARSSPSAPSPCPACVTLDATVTAAGEAVTDLAAADMQIDDGGGWRTPQNVRYVAIPAAHRSLDAGTSPAPALPATNEHPADSRLFVVVFDDGRATLASVNRAKAFVRELIQAVTPDDRIAILFMRRADLSQPPTASVADLVRTTDRFVEAAGTDIPDITMNFVDRASRTLYAAIDRTAFTRRAIVLVSTGGLFLQVQGEDMMTLASVARRANAPLHAIDTGEPRLGDTAPTEDVLRAVARATGGMPVLGRSDLAGVATQIALDTGRAYRIRYVPSAAADGRFHPVRIRVNRPGLTIAARAGFVAPLANASDADAGRLVDEAVAAPLPRDGVPLRATVEPGQGQTCTVRLDVDYANAPPAAGDDDLLIRMVAKDSGERATTLVDRRVHVTAADRANGTVERTERVTLPAGTLTVTAGVFSHALGRVGTVVLRLPD
jgi:VWFA-related protein